MRPVFLIAVLALLPEGCASTHRKSMPVSAMIRMNETGIASIPVGPTPQMPPVEKAALDDAPIPVYTNPRVAKVHVAAYINDKGEAFQETYKYVFVDEGHWNIEAQHNPERAYIPADNVLKPQAAPGVIWGTVAPGEAVPPASAEHRSHAKTLRLGPNPRHRIFRPGRRTQSPAGGRKSGRKIRRSGGDILCRYCVDYRSPSGGYPRHCPQPGRPHGNTRIGTGETTAAEIPG